MVIRIENELRAITSGCTGLVPAGVIDEVNELVGRGEFGVALELLCDELFEFDADVPAPLYAALERAGSSVDLDPLRWVLLKRIDDADLEAEGV